MEEITQFVGNYGYGLIFVWVMLDQFGVPIPAIPVLIIAGAMSGGEQMDLGVVVLAATAGCVPSDIIWFEAGRRRGGAVLKTLCKISLEPDSCVRDTKDTFARHGMKSLLVAKLIPGYQTLSPALAGMTGVSLPRFMAFDLPGALLWSALFIVPGYLFREQVEVAMDAIARFGSGIGTAVVLVLVGYAGWKFWHRQQILRSLRIARMLPEELKATLDRGGEVTVVDLRDSISLDQLPHRIPGARVISVDEIDARHEEIPRDQDVVLYCT